MDFIIDSGIKHDFLWAVAQMKEGKKVKRQNENLDAYGSNSGLLTSFNLLDGKFDPDIGILIKELEATDWEIVEDKKNLSEKIEDKIKRQVMPYSFSYVVGIKYAEDLFKESLKEFLEDILGMKLEQVQRTYVRDRAKEIFGERLVE